MGIKKFSEIGINEHFKRVEIDIINGGWIIESTISTKINETSAKNGNGLKIRQNKTDYVISCN